MRPDVRDPQLEAWLDAGIHLFDARRFWHAHEAWEDAWRACPELDRDGFQGLILTTAACFKLDQPRGRARALVRLLSKARQRLERVDPRWRGLDMPRLIQHTVHLADLAQPWVLDDTGWQRAYPRHEIPTLSPMRSR